MARDFGIRWTSRDLMALEWTESGLPGQQGAEGQRVVSLGLADGRFTVKPFDNFSPEFANSGRHSMGFRSSC